MESALGLVSRYLVKPTVELTAINMRTEVENEEDKSRASSHLTDLGHAPLWIVDVSGNTSAV
jgi:hypothetical protein